MPCRSVRSSPNPAPYVFRLWAPKAHKVELVLTGPSAPQSATMQSSGDGWFALETHAAHPGSLYRYRIDGAQEVPDPASRFNPQGVHGPSEVIDAGAYAWDDATWRAPAWHAVVIYELHVGTFDPAGTYAAIIPRLAQLVRLGVTAIELMPLAAFPGERGWGYDGVLLYAPQVSYGRPEDLKALVAAAHRHGLAVILDVVYNHFGPEGNYLHLYAPQFFNEKKQTPPGHGHQLIVEWTAARSVTSSSRTPSTGCRNTTSTACDWTRCMRCTIAASRISPTNWRRRPAAATGPRGVYLDTRRNFDEQHRFARRPGGSRAQ